MGKLDKICETSEIQEKGFYVYQGLVNGDLVYIGTTTQKPADRFRWHKANKKPFDFEIVAICGNAEEMLDLEWELIRTHKPKHNKITGRRQNLNIKLSEEELAARVGDKTWCQSCLRRRVNKGYDKCSRC